MVLGVLLGLPLGVVIGVLLGRLIWPRFFKPVQWGFGRRVDWVVDDDDQVPYPPQGRLVTWAGRAKLEDVSPSLTQPDFERLLFLNTLMSMTWSRMSPAVFEQVLAQSQYWIDYSIGLSGGVLRKFEILSLDLGSIPPRLDSLRSITLPGEEFAVEAALFWGGGLELEALATLGIGNLAGVTVPIRVSSVSFKALARITVGPLVETLPCIGGASVSLLELPHVDAEVSLGGGFDLLALPFAPAAVRYAMRTALGFLVHPNSMAFPIMEGFGIPPEPKGMLRIKVLGARGLHSDFLDTVDPFVVLEVREGRPLHSSVKDNDENPNWDEEFEFVIDDPESQDLRLSVRDDDLLASSLVGAAVVPLCGAEWIEKPGVPVRAAITIREVPKGGEPSEGGPGEAVGHAEANPEAANPGAAEPAAAGIGTPSSNAAAAEATAANASAAKVAAATAAPPQTVSPEVAAAAAAAATPRPLAVAQEASADLLSQFAEASAAARHEKEKRKKKPSAMKEIFFSLGIGKRKHKTAKKAAEAETATSGAGAGTRAGPDSRGGGASPPAAAGEASSPSGKGRLGRLIQGRTRRGDAEVDARHPHTIVLDAAAASPGARPGGDGSKRDKGKIKHGEATGVVLVEMTYFPFRQASAAEPGPTSVAPEAGADTGSGAGAGPGAKPQTRSAAGRGGRGRGRKQAKKVRESDPDRGVISVDVKRCVALASPCDTYIVCTANDPLHPRTKSIEFQSPVVLEEETPHYKFRTDFVNVSEQTKLTVTVFEMPSSLKTVLAKIPIIGHKSKHKMLGYVQVTAQELIKEGRISERWPLQEAEAGEMDLAVQWTPVIVDDILATSRST